MYTVMVKKEFDAARALLTGAANPGSPERRVHNHHYICELLVEGEELDEHGYLVNVDELAGKLEAQLAYIKNRFLNELHEFTGLNPSLERLARLLCERLAGEFNLSRLGSLTIKLWENGQTWGAFRLSLYMPAPPAQGHLC
jgi:6-pyruvoyltetrahydropterin/6-carboxytetrahydropterin synthase